MALSEGYLTTVDGVRLFFRKIGTGKHTIVFPNGLYLAADFARLADHRTIVFYDVRNRGRSDTVTDPAKLARGVEQDVDDLEAVRRHLGLERVDLIGHSYIGVILALYAMAYPAHAGRIVAIGPSPPVYGTQYSPHLAYADGVLDDVMAELGQLRVDLASVPDPVERCRKFWSVLRRIYVVDPADAARIDWGRCDQPNESGFMKYWTEHLVPSMQRLSLGPDIGRATAPILIVHGTKDRSAPYGGGREWAAILPNARLLTVQDAGHAPWIEDPDRVFDAIETFLDGAWPAAAEGVDSLAP